MKIFEYNLDADVANGIHNEITPYKFHHEDMCETLKFASLKYKNEMCLVLSAFIGAVCNVWYSCNHGLFQRTALSVSHICELTNAARTAPNSAKNNLCG